MPRLVHSSQFTVHSSEKSVNRRPSTVDKRQRRLGFTLIELLVVIAIIGIMSSFGILGYQSSQKKARDGQRKSDLAQVKKALEAAKSDCLAGSYYPYTSGNESDAFSTLVTNLSNSNLKYLQNKIQDPKNSTPYIYRLDRSSTTTNVCPDTSGSLTVTGTKNYVLRTTLEITQDPEIANSRTKCQNTIDNMSSPSWDTTNNGSAPATGDGYFYACPD